MLESIIEDHRAWIGADLDPADWTIDLPTQAVNELPDLVRALQADPLPTLLRTPEDFQIPALRLAMGKAKRALDLGCGFTILRGFPVEDYGLDDMVTVFWLLGQLIGRPVAQKFDGTMIYDVTDTGKNYGYGVRGSHTRVELNFHTDNAFGTALPQYVGLFCWQPSISGGISRFCSLYTLHNRLLREFPDHLRRLYEPVLYDRQAEHHPSAAKTTMAPFFHWDGERLLCRANVSLIRKGHDIAGKTINPTLASAVQAVEDILNDPTVWAETRLGRGDLHYLNNIDVAHYRSDFIDHPDAGYKRRLYRTWHRDKGKQTYDG